MGKNNNKTYQLHELIKPDNAEKLKELGRLENLDELEKIFDLDEELSKYIKGSGSELIGRCGKMVYIAMLTCQNQEMTAKQVRDLVNKVYAKKWTKKAVKNFLERLALMKLVLVRHDFYKTYYRLYDKNAKDFDSRTISEAMSIAGAKLELRKDCIKKRF